MDLDHIRQRQLQRLRRVCDSVPQLSMFKADEQEGIFARQLVLETMTEIFRHEFEQYKWATGELIALDNRINEGALEYSYNEIASVGKAKIIADDATDIPDATAKGKSNVGAIKTIGCKFSYSTQEVRTAMLQGTTQIVEEKSTSARESHDLGRNDLIRVGDGAAGLHGMTNAPGIIVQQAVTGTWSSATSEQIVADFTAAANTIMEQSRGVEEPNTAAFPIAQHLRISTLPFDSANGSNLTVLDYLKKAFPMITNWTWDAGLSTAAADGGAAVMIYRKDPMRARSVEPMLLRPTAPEQRGLTFTVTLESRFGGVMVPRPRSAVRLEGTD